MENCNTLNPMPPLPQIANYDPKIGESVGSFVNTYVKYGSAAAPMTPILFHESAALILPSIAIARRLVLPMAFGHIYPNLFIVWIALSTLYNKTTALDKAKFIARSVFPHLLALQDTTPEALLSDLAGQKPSNYSEMSEDQKMNWAKECNFAAQKGLILDEMSGLMAGAGKDYNAGLIEAFMKFYDCESEFGRSTRKDGRIVVRNSYFSLLGASTPLAMAKYINSERLWGMGWWPRFSLLTPETERPDWKEAVRINKPESLTSDLNNLYSRLPVSEYPDPPKAITVVLGEGVYEVWNHYNKALRYDLLMTPELDERLFPTYGRFPVVALKISMILAAMDWKNEPAPRIELPHIVRAISIAESWRESAHRALSIGKSYGLDNVKSKVIDTIQRCESKGGATMRDLTRAISTNGKGDLERALAEMQEAKMIEAVTVKPGPNGGRPTTRFRVL